jgi:hypothetical protein
LPNSETASRLLYLQCHMRNDRIFSGCSGLGKTVSESRSKSRCTPSPLVFVASLQQATVPLTSALFERVGPPRAEEQG